MTLLVRFVDASAYGAHNQMEPIMKNLSPVLLCLVASLSASFVSSFLLAGCQAAEDYRVAAINKAEAYFYSYRKEYDAFSKIKTYQNVASFTSFPDHEPQKHLFLSFNRFDAADFDDSFDALYEAVAKNRAFLVFYNFTDLSFLKGTKLDYFPKSDDYSVADNQSVAFCNRNLDGGFSRDFFSYGEGSGKASFADTVLNYAYSKLSEA